MFVNKLEKKNFLTARTVIICVNSITARHNTFSCWKLLRSWGLSEWASALCHKTAKLWGCWRCSAFKNRFHPNAYINSKTQSHKHTMQRKKQKLDRCIFRWRHGSSKSQSLRVHPTSKRGYVWLCLVWVKFLTTLHW